MSGETTSSPLLSLSVGHATATTTTTPFGRVKTLPTIDTQTTTTTTTREMKRIFNFDLNSFLKYLTNSKKSPRLSAKSIQIKIKN